MLTCSGASSGSSRSCMPSRTTYAFLGGPSALLTLSGACDDTRSSRSGGQRCRATARCSLLFSSLRRPSSSASSATTTSRPCLPCGTSDRRSVIFSLAPRSATSQSRSGPAGVASVSWPLRSSPWSCCSPSRRYRSRSSRSARSRICMPTSSCLSIASPGISFGF